MSLIYTRVLEILSEYSLSMQELEQRVARLEAATASAGKQPQDDAAAVDAAAVVAAASVAAPPPNKPPSPSSSAVVAGAAAAGQPAAGQPAAGPFDVFVRENREAIDEFIRDFESISGKKLCATAATEIIWGQLPKEEKEKYKKLARRTAKST